MAEFVLKYADSRGEIHQQVAHAGSEKELRDRYTQQGFLIYSIKTKRGLTGDISGGLLGGRKKLNMEKFLIFNQQFVTLNRAGLPILKGLDLSWVLTSRPFATKSATALCFPTPSKRRAFSRKSTSLPSWPARKAAVWRRCSTVLFPTPSYPWR
jgi:hypothetical protein